MDPLVSAQVGQLTKAKLGEFVPNVTAKIYRGLGHSSNEEVIKLQAANIIFHCQYFLITLFALVEKI
jgi:hypothetical protein